MSTGCLCLHLAMCMHVPSLNRAKSTCRYLLHKQGKAPASPGLHSVHSCASFSDL